MLIKLTELHRRLQKSKSTDLQAKHPDSHWVTVKNEDSPLKGRHILVSGKGEIIEGAGSKHWNKPEPQEPAKPAVKKEPWEMTKEEYFDNKMKDSGFRRGAQGEYTKVTDDQRFLEWKKGENNQNMNRLYYEKEQKKLIENALRQGKPVPEEVLADYPDLKPKAGKKKQRLSPSGRGSFADMGNAPKEGEKVWFLAGQMADTPKQGVIKRRSNIDNRGLLNNYYDIESEGKTYHVSISTMYPTEPVQTTKDDQYGTMTVWDSSETRKKRNVQKSIHLYLPIPGLPQPGTIRKGMSGPPAAPILNIERARKWRDTIRLFKSQHPTDPEPPYIKQMRDLLHRHVSRYGEV